MYRTLMIISAVFDALVRAAGNAIYHATNVAEAAEDKAVRVRREANAAFLLGAQAAAEAASKRLSAASAQFAAEANAISNAHPGR